MHKHTPDRMNPRARMSVPRGLLAGITAALALTWGLFALDSGGWPGLRSPLAQSAIYLTLGTITVRSRRAKVVIVRSVQRFTINPLMRLLLRAGVNPLGLAILETRGRVSGQPRRTPVGNGHTGDTFWIIAEHGERAGYVRNIRHDPHVRVRLEMPRDAAARESAAATLATAPGMCPRPARLLRITVVDEQLPMAASRTR
jgi:deazaflavin-dependent oxidoreductase (nitroreductase family)